MAMDLIELNAHLDIYKQNEQILEAADFLLQNFGMELDMLEGFDYRDDEQPNFVVVTTEGDFGAPQKIRIPRNLFDFNLRLVLNLIAHEVLHLKQKTEYPYLEDKNEREFLAYSENLYHREFPQIPEAPDFNRQQFAQKALEYYSRMGEGSDLQKKYADAKAEVERTLEDILIKRGVKNED